MERSAGKALHQFVPMLMPRDAVGGHTLAIQEMAVAAGYDSRIFVDTTSGAEPAEVCHFTSYPEIAASDDILIYQLAVASPMVEMLLRREEPLVVNYHNITPAAAFSNWDYVSVLDQTRARDELIQLAKRASGGLAVSRFNESELVGAGYQRTAVLPVLSIESASETPVDSRTASRLSSLKASGGSDWLFVGRLAPNKRQDLLLQALFAYQKLYDPLARLHLVGRGASPAYASAIGVYADRLGIGDSTDLPGEVSDAELSAYYQNADVFVCLSEHEGFGAPLLEALEAELPVIAYAAGAIPEMLAGSGILLRSQAPVEVASAVSRVLSDGALRDELANRGRSRLRELNLVHARESTLSTLLELAGRK